MPDGSFVFAPIGLEPLDRALGIEWEFLAEDRRELTSELIRDYDALFHFSPAVSAASLANPAVLEAEAFQEKLSRFAL